jgi:hypothetical protein
MSPKEVVENVFQFFAVVQKTTRSTAMYKIISKDLALTRSSTGIK